MKFLCYPYVVFEVLLWLQSSQGMPTIQGNCPHGMIRNTSKVCGYPVACQPTCPPQSARVCTLVCHGSPCECPVGEVLSKSENGTCIPVLQCPGSEVDPNAVVCDNSNMVHRCGCNYTCNNDMMTSSTTICSSVCQEKDKRCECPISHQYQHGEDCLTEEQCKTLLAPTTTVTDVPVVIQKTLEEMLKEKCENWWNGNKQTTLGKHMTIVYQDIANSEDNCTYTSCMIIAKKSAATIVGEQRNCTANDVNEKDFCKSCNLTP